ncbi:MAG: TolC family protein, partial [Geminicoccaceae bacterium]
TYRNVINQEPVSLSPPPVLQEIPENEGEAQDLAEGLNPNILAAEYNLAAAREDIRIAESALLPSLDLQGELSYDDDPNLAVDWQRTALIGLRLRVPLYQGGGEYAGVRQAKQTVGQRQSDLEAAIRAVREETTGSWQALVTARSRITSIQEQVKAAEIALEGSRQEAQVGQRTTLDVLDQENDLFQAGVDLVQAQRDEIVASYRLKAAIGQLTAPELKLPVDVYDAEAHYQAVRNRLFGLGK